MCQLVRCDYVCERLAALHAGGEGGMQIVGDVTERFYLLLACSNLSDGIKDVAE